jgi:DNA-binding HxlR family transcriptional regulator
VAKSSALRAEAAGRPLRAETGDGMGAERANHTANPAIPDLDRLIHERIRLGIVSALAAAKNPLTFNDLKHLLRTTDGNLSVHARKLEEAKYIGCVKSFEGRVPKTEYSLTAAGRRAFEKYLDHMEAIIQASKR